MSIYHVDIETRSRCDLKTRGAHRYARDASTEILCLAIAKGNNEPRIWVPKVWRHLVEHDIIAEELLFEMSFDKEAIVYAHNASFEVACLTALMEKTTGFKPPHHSQWRCTAAMGRRAALPASLEKLAEALKLGHQKDPKGKALIRKFSIPQTVGKLKGQFINPEDDPEAFKEFTAYCKQDVAVEQEIHRVLKDFELSGTPLETFILDMEINGRGFPVNLDALHKALKIVEEESSRLTDQFTKLTGCSPNQNAVFLAWLKSRGYEGDNLRAETLEETLEDADFDPTTEVGQALQLKKMISYASLKKIPAMINCAGPHDNRVRGTLTFHGAGTGRWSATLVQPQNFKRPTIDETEAVYAAVGSGCSAEWLREMFGSPLEMISSSIRHFIHDVDQGPMLSADYAAIEARVIAWQAQEVWKMEVFRTHGKIYEATACQMFGMQMSDFDDYKKKTGKNHPARQKAKSGELGCGFAGGVGALLKMGALKQGLTEKELGPIVKAWRDANPNICKFWRDIDQAAKNAIKQPNTQFHFGIGCHFYSAKTAGMLYLFMVLPNGRRIAYPQPELVPQLSWKTPDKEEVNLVEGAYEITEVPGRWFFQLNPRVEDVLKVRQMYSNVRTGEAITIYSSITHATWGRVPLSAGTLTENCVQGIAFDFMAEGALNASKAGYEICALIHDEALSAYHPEKGQTLEEFVALLTQLPSWAEGMPLKAEGDIVKFYKK
jgi:DNA polymerase